MSSSRTVPSSSPAISAEELDSAVAMERFHNLVSLFFFFSFSDYFSTHRVPSFPSQDAHSRPEARSKLNLAQARGRVLVQGKRMGV